MNPILLKEAEKVTDCVDPRKIKVEGPIQKICEQCHNTPFRISVIEEPNGARRNLALCGGHFSEFRSTNPGCKELLR
jgi:hypothetical protein